MFLPLSTSQSSGTPFSGVTIRRLGERPHIGQSSATAIRSVNAPRATTADAATANFVNIFMRSFLVVTYRDVVVINLTFDRRHQRFAKQAGAAVGVGLIVHQLQHPFLRFFFSLGPHLAF